MSSVMKFIFSHLYQYKTWWWVWILSLIGSLFTGYIVFFSNTAHIILLTAKNDLAIGHVIKESDLVKKMWPINTAPKGYFSDSQPLINKIITEPINQGLPIVSNNLKNLSSIIENQIHQPRLVTLSVNEGDIDRELISQGDSIDLWYRQKNNFQISHLIANVEVQHLHIDSTTHTIHLTVKLTAQQLTLLPVNQLDWQLQLLLHPTHHHAAPQYSPVEIIRGVMP